ncbi:CRTAC1 family protein [Pseudenhygromyxa sp. WMMC2535]|uniref:CRTAC1 family protein n=1 Tax=Pseudenhygromyxa sp. WMMC2535 TaxID=2712867 RepID=UPI0015528FA8|nr:CRTAC1 family protein [Pseudenhygromyxa sp. WMMC2535]NVB42496.1 CRTAC1 family protein [Pseudenhygromyxa sp. WMMC2535]
MCHVLRHGLAWAGLGLGLGGCLVAPTIEGGGWDEGGSWDDDAGSEGSTALDHGVESDGLEDATGPQEGPGSGDMEDGEVTPSDLGCCTAEQVLFTEVSVSAGIDHSHGDGFPLPGDCLIDTLLPPKENFFCAIDWSTAGAAAGDVDGDGWVDLYVTRLFEPGILYRNRGDGSFEDATAEFGLAGLDHQSGASWADFDNDGDLDLYVSTVGDLRHRLLINYDGWFIDEAGPRGASLESGHPQTGTSVAPGDYDNDGWLDLYVGDWHTNAIGEFPAHARLLHNRGAAEPAIFDDLTEAAGVVVDDVYLESSTETPSVGTFVLGVAWADLDGDGWVELVQSADFGCSRLFWNQGEGSFLDGTFASGVGTDRDGMGTAIADYDRDGDLDWFVTSIMGPYNDGNRLYRNLGARQFDDQTDALGVRDGFWAWGAVFFDQDNDGDLDLALTNGWRATLHFDDPIVSWTNEGGVMVENPSTLGLADTGQGRGMIRFDYDRDGDIDLFVANQGGAPKLFRNDTITANHWLEVELRGTSSNRDGLGARVEIEVEGERQLHEVGAGDVSYLGHSERAAHFGLGQAEQVGLVRVTWPASGVVQVFTDLAVDQRVLVVEG